MPGAKKTKKKGSKGKKDEWTLEGGTSFSAAKPVRDENGKKLFRHSQEKDEKMRRGMLKGRDNDRKRAFERKMRAKPSQAQYLTTSEAEAADVADEAEEEDETPAAKRVRGQSGHSVLARLRMFAERARPAEGGSEDGEGSEGSGVDGEEQDEDVEGEDDDRSDHDGICEDEERDSDAADAADGFAAEVHTSAHHWLFDEATAAVAAGTKITAAVDSLGLEVAGELRVPEEFRAPYQPKLWSKGGTSPHVFDAPATRALLPHLGTYADVLLEGRSHKTEEGLLLALMSHLGMHVLHSREVVLRHNSRLKAKRAKALVRAARNKASKGRSAVSGESSSESGSEEEGSADEEGEGVPGAAAEQSRAGAVGSIADQGFVRPRTLILCPFRGVAMRVIQQLADVFGPNTTVGGEEKFADEYGAPDFSDDDDDDEEEDEHEDEDEGAGGSGSLEAKEKKKQKKRTRRPKPPADWRADFRQNVDDDFKIGIQVNPGKGKGAGPAKGVFLRLFSDFYISDIIIASPLGLRFAIESASAGEDGSDSEAEGKGQKDTAAADFLSSVEVVLVHQADVLLMQNWEHVNFVLGHLNHMPKRSHDTDFSRVRPYFLEEQAAAHRQLIMTSHFSDANINSSFRRHGRSLAGTLRVRRQWHGCLGDVMTNMRQLFQQLPQAANSPEAEDDARWNYFQEHILMPMLRTGQTRTLIVAPSYVHYVRIRNELLRLEANAAFVCEYSRDSEISRGRSRFYHGRHDILLYSGRCHFFRRYRIRGAQHVVFYGLPEYETHYPEVLNLLSSESDLKQAGAQRQASLAVQSHSFDKTAGSEGSGNKSCTALVLFSALDVLALNRIDGS